MSGNDRFAVALLVVLFFLTPVASAAAGPGRVTFDAAGPIELEGDFVLRAGESRFLGTLPPEGVSATGRLESATLVYYKWQMAEGSVPAAPPLPTITVAHAVASEREASEWRNASIRWEAADEWRELRAETESGLLELAGRARASGDPTVLREPVAPRVAAAAARPADSYDPIPGTMPAGWFLPRAGPRRQLSAAGWA